MVGAVEDSTINIVVVIIIIIVVVYAMHVTVLEFASGRIDNCLLN